MSACLGCDVEVSGPKRLCAGCRESRRRSRTAIGAGNKRRNHFDIDDLAVQCWCRRGIVFVPVADVRRCLTRSCGLAGCEQ